MNNQNIGKVRQGRNHGTKPYNRPSVNKDADKSNSIWTSVAGLMPKWMTGMFNHEEGEPITDEELAIPSTTASSGRASLNAPITSQAPPTSESMYLNPTEPVSEHSALGTLIQSTQHGITLQKHPYAVVLSDDRAVINNRFSSPRAVSTPVPHVSNLVVGGNFSKSHSAGCSIQQSIDPRKLLLGGGVSNEVRPLVSQNDNQSDCSESSVSTSGCSSMVPHPDKKDYQTELLTPSLPRVDLDTPIAGASGFVRHALPAQTKTGMYGGLKNIPAALADLDADTRDEPAAMDVNDDSLLRLDRTDSWINDSTLNMSVRLKTSIFGSSISRPQSPANIIGKASFNASAFGSPLANRSLLAGDGVTSSPFYKGRTTYGGASAHQRLKLSTPGPYSLSNRRTPVPPVSLAAVQKATGDGETDSRLMTATARRMMLAMENMSTPRNDAQKIPMNDSPLSFNIESCSRHRRPNLASKITARLSDLAVPSGGPPVDCFAATNPSPRVQFFPASSEAAQEEEERSSSAMDTGTYTTGGGGKIKSSKESRHYSTRQKDSDENMYSQSSLPSVPLPINVTNLPRIELNQLQSRHNQPTTSSQNPSQSSNFTFTSPAYSTPPASTARVNEMTFSFSSPMSVDVYRRTKAVAPASTTAKVTVTAPVAQATSRSSPVTAVNFSSDVGKTATLTPKKREREVVVNDLASPIGTLKPVAQLKTGSVMDILGGKKPATVEPKWTCPSCMVPNEPSAPECVCCTEPKPGAAPPKSSAEPIVMNTWGDKFKPPPGTWECQACLVRNSPDHLKCKSCETERTDLPKRAAPPPQPSFKFGLTNSCDNKDGGAASKKVENGFVTSPIGGFRLGGGSTPLQPAPELAGIKFGAAKATDSSSVNTNFVFGCPQKSTGVTGAIGSSSVEAGGFKLGQDLSAAKPAAPFNTVTPFSMAANPNKKPLQDSSSDDGGPPPKLLAFPGLVGISSGIPLTPVQPLNPMANALQPNFNSLPNATVAQTSAIFDSSNTGVKPIQSNFTPVADGVVVSKSNLFGSGFGNGSVSPAVSTDPSSGFVFGSAAAPAVTSNSTPGSGLFAAPAPSFSVFGNSVPTPTTTTAPASSTPVFSIGAFAATATTAQTIATTTNNAIKPLMFGVPNTTAPPNTAGGSAFTFGGNPNAAPAKPTDSSTGLPLIFGGPNSAATYGKPNSVPPAYTPPTATTASLFGGGISTGTPIGGLSTAAQFGQTNGGLFNAGMFGQGSSTFGGKPVSFGATTSSFLGTTSPSFGNSGGGSFGGFGSNGVTTSTQSVFGSVVSPTVATNSAAPPQGLFGGFSAAPVAAVTTAAPTAFGGFGGLSSSSGGFAAQSNSVFGTSPAVTSGFGAPAQPTTGNVFASSSFGFGGAQPQATAFGGSATSPPVYGSPAASQISSAFNQAPAPAGVFRFNANNPTPPPQTGFSGFGQPVVQTQPQQMNPAPAAFQFNPSAQPQFNFAGNVGGQPNPTGGFAFNAAGANPFNAIGGNQMNARRTKVASRRLKK